jgi:beta-galactosidase
MLFGAAYYPEHRPESCWDVDLDNLAAMGANAVRIGEFAWVRFEPADGRYDFSWTDRFLDAAWKRGIGVMLCPPLRTIPAWLRDQADLRIVTDMGLALEYGARYTFCINQPLLRAKGFALAERLAAQYAHHPALRAWQLDNEIGGEEICHCECCRRQWIAWLQTQYHSIADLNTAWGTVFWGLEFQDFSQVPTPKANHNFKNPGLHAAWWRFRADCNTSLVREHAAALRRFAAQPVCTNYGGSGVDSYAVAAELDQSAVNYYPWYRHDSRWQEEALARTRAHRRRPFHVVELCNQGQAVPGDDTTPAPGDIARMTLQCLAHGAEGIFYFRYDACPFGQEQNHGALTSQGGEPNRAYREVAQTGATLRPIVHRLDAAPRVAAQAAVLDEALSGFMLERGWYWDGPHDLRGRQQARAYRALRRCHINVDFTSPDQDWGNYRLLVVPLTVWADDGLAEKLAAFVEDGGTLVTHPLCFVRNRESAIHPRRLHPRLERLLGASVAEYATVRPGVTMPFRWRGVDYQGELFGELPEVREATVEGEYTRGWYAGTPAVLRRSVGAGCLVHVATIAEERFHDDLLAALVREAGIAPILPGAIPEDVELTERSGPDGQRLIFALNWGDRPVSLQLPGPMEELLIGQKAADDVCLDPGVVRVLAYEAGRYDQPCTGEY